MKLIEGKKYYSIKEIINKLNEKFGFDFKKDNTQIVEIPWEIIVARAAPDTPKFKTKIIIGSNIILHTAPIKTVSIPVLAKPWAVIKAFIPNVNWTKIVPNA